MINEDLLIDGNIISDYELNKILSPLSEKQVQQYAEQLSLTGLNKDINDYLQKMSAFLSSGNTESFNPNYSVIEEEKTVILYHRQIQDLNGQLVWENCTPDTENAVGYEYKYKVKKLVLNNNKKLSAVESFKNKSENYQEQMKNALYTFIDSDNKNLLGLLYADFDDFYKDFLVLEEIFLYNPFMTNKVIIEIINDLLTNIENLKNWNKQNYNEKKYFNNDEMAGKLGYLKAMYIAYYNAYEQACNLGFSGYKTTQGYELDEGI